MATEVFPPPWSTITTLLRMTPLQERHGTAGREWWSLFISLLFHGFLALVLWCLVINVTRQESIFLIGSTSIPPSDFPLDVTMEQAAETAPAERTRPTEKTPGRQQAVNAALDALIADALRANQPADADRSTSEPPSVEFFGARAYGEQFVFLLDISYSMNARQGARFQRARDELLRAVSELQSGQSYYVFLFCWNVEEMRGARERFYLDVKSGHVQKLRRWLNDASLGPGTDPRRALALARRMNPDAVFLLSDGQFNQPRTPWSESGWLGEKENQMDLGVQEGVERFYRSIPIHTISFENPFTVDAMERIARSSGGSFQYVRTDSLRPVDRLRFLKLLAEIDRKYGQEVDPTREYQARLSAARELICDGELLYAEYIVRPLAEAPRAKILNPTLLDDVMEILRSELSETRLEDFESPPSDSVPILSAETTST